MVGGFKISRGRPVSSGSYPASISAPSAGTSLASVYDLSASGATGPRFSPSNGSWGARALAANGQLTGDTYLNSISGGVRVNNVGTALSFTIPEGTTVTFEKYDFTGVPVKIHCDSDTGHVIFNDCTFTGGTGDAGSITWPVNINDGGVWAGSHMVVDFNYCLFDKATFYNGSGVTTFDHCRFKNQVQGLGDSSFGSSTYSRIIYNDCYITGGGVYGPYNAVTGWAHIELSQMINSHPSSGLFWNRCHIDLIDGQATTTSQAGWTGLSSGGAIEEMTDCIVRGFPAIDANPNNGGNKSNCILAYGTGGSPVMTNCAVDRGQYGYTSNLTPGPPYSGVNGGGNRTFTTNTALVTSDFG